MHHTLSCRCKLARLTPYVPLILKEASSTWVFTTMLTVHGPQVWYFQSRWKGGIRICLGSDKIAHLCFSSESVYGWFVDGDVESLPEICSLLRQFRCVYFLENNGLLAMQRVLRKARVNPSKIVVRRREDGGAVKKLLERPEYILRCLGAWYWFNLAHTLIPNYRCPHPTRFDMTVLYKGPMGHTNRPPDNKMAHGTRFKMDIKKHMCP